ncbi:YidC/Oxa1 family membrane protein insertase [Streptococcus caprae]|uniref:Membrane protein insertase YidC n=1 Tax=Streptococcus caprae TaxID=1640501 RepID=A0ABV8CTZ5_9STRE
MYLNSQTYIRKVSPVNKKIKLTGLAGAALLLLSACGRSDITSQSSGLWEQIVYFFAQMIKALSFGGLVGVGIVLFTILIRLVMLPLYNQQIKSSREMQEIQPKLREIQLKYPGKDTESRMLMAEEQQALYKEHNINPYASLWPLFIQMPILMALYQALTRVEFLRVGKFLWMDLGSPDPYYILPILAAVFTFLSSWLTNKSAKESNTMLTTMTFVMPAMILLIALNMASGVALYWTVSNAFQVAQIMIFNNPFKLIEERQRIVQEEKEKAARKRRAMKKAQRKK